MARPSAIDVPELDLNFCSVEEHCRALQASGQVPFWWYLGTSRLWGNFSVPFMDRNGNWWLHTESGDKTSPTLSLLIWASKYRFYSPNVCFGNLIKCRLFGGKQARGTKP